MSLQELPKTAAETAVKLVRVPVDLANKAREGVEKRIGGGDKSGAEVKKPAVAPSKVKAAKPKAAKKPAAKKPAAKKPAAKKKPVAVKTPKASAVDRAEDARKKLQNGAGGR